MSARVKNKAFLLSPAVQFWASMAAILLTGLLVYANNYHGEFIFDDFPAIVDNPEVQSFSSLGPLLHPAPNTPLSARPVAAVTFALNYAWGGLDVRGYHLVNNLIHILAALALFGLVRATLLLPRLAPVYGTRAEGYGLAVSLIWLVHPLNSEVVNYIMCRTESLVGLFYFLTMLCASLAFRVERPQKWYTAAVAACGLGMASKEVMVSAPILVLLYDRLFAAGSIGAALRQRPIFYLALAATWLVVGFYQLDNPRAETVLFDSAWMSVPDYLRTQLTVIVHYLRLSFWPHPLVLDSQDWPVIRGLTPSLILSFLLVATLALSTLIGLWRNAWWSILGVWFFFILAPTSSFIPIVTEIVSERRMYLPMAAVVVLVSFTSDYLWRQVSVSMAGRVVRLVPILVFMAIIVLFAAMTSTRNRDYRTAISIWTDTVAKRPGNYRAHENLGKALLAEGRYPEAAQHLKTAVELFPEKKIDAALYSSLALALSQSGEYREALAAQRNALAAEPSDPPGHYNLGNIYLRLGDLENAALSFQEAIALDPAFAPAHGNLGMLLLEKGDFAGAEAHFLALLGLSQADPTPRLLLGDLYRHQGKIPEATRWYQEALRLAPGASEIESRLLELQATGPAHGQGDPGVVQP